tara:strand:+ start:1405 stop:1596 length:192 start_codon:yes stop_codon:yes gene_type:complete
MKDAVIDSIKTVSVSSGGFFVTWVEWLPVTVRIAVGLATVVYLYYKVLNERLTYEEKKANKKK